MKTHIPCARQWFSVFVEKKSQVYTTEFSLYLKCLTLLTCGMLVVHNNQHLLTCTRTWGILNDGILGWVSELTQADYKATEVGFETTGCKMTE